MKSRNGFSRAYRLGFDPVSIPLEISGWTYDRIGNQSTGILSDEKTSGPTIEGKGESGGKVREEAESVMNKYLANIRGTYGDHMEKTGIGVIVEVQAVTWIAENRRYPAEYRYLGELVTVAEEEIPFVSDIPVPTKEEGWKAIGRFRQDGTLLEISDHDNRGNERL